MYPAPLLLAALAGCVAVAAGEGGMAPFDAHAETWPHSDGAGGFDRLDVDAVWSAGDFARYWIESAAGGERCTWTIELSLPSVPGPLTAPFGPQFGDPASGFVRAANALSQTESGSVDRSIWARYCWYPVDLRVQLQRHEDGECLEVVVPTQAQAHVWQPRVDAEPTFGIDFLFRVLIKVDRLLDALLSVVKPPSTWSVLQKGMRVEVGLELHPLPQPEVFEIDTPFGRQPAFWLPATLRANDQVALECRFLITWRRSPLLLTMGVLRIEGHHPDDPGRWVTVQLIAARRGSEPVIDRDRLGRGLRRGMTEEQFVAAVHGTAGDRYRVRNAAGRVIDLVSVQGADPPVDLVGAFEQQRLLYCNHGGMVSLFLKLRGFDDRPYRSENRVGSGEPKR